MCCLNDREVLHIWMEYQVHVHEESHVVYCEWWVVLVLVIIICEKNACLFVWSYVKSTCGEISYTKGQWLHLCLNVWMQL